MRTRRSPSVPGSERYPYKFRVEYSVCPIGNLEDQRLSRGQCRIFGNVCNIKALWTNDPCYISQGWVLGVVILVVAMCEVVTLGWKWVKQIFWLRLPIHSYKHDTKWGADAMLAVVAFTRCLAALLRDYSMLSSINHWAHESFCVRMPKPIWLSVWT